VAGDFEGQAESVVVSTALNAAQSLAERHYEALLKLYAQIRQVHQAHLARLREVEGQLREISRRADIIRSKPAETLDQQQVLELVELEDQIQPLRQQQQWLVEQLTQEAWAGRKIRAVAQQSAMAVNYLRGTEHEGSTVADVADLAGFQILQAKEDERRRLARDVHDGPAQVLANAVFGLEWCKRVLARDPSQLEAELENIAHDLRIGLDDVRQFIYDLSPVSFTEVEFTVSLRRYLQKFSERTGIVANLSIPPDLGRVPGPIEMGVFRIIQEALQNVRKHSRASRVDVAVVCDDSSLRVTIEDDGVGFDRSLTPSDGVHFGLVSMSERARLLNGELVIDSEPNGGTRVSLTVPLSEPNRDLSEPGVVTDSLGES
jgi:two-component system sensor histidine kinase DegS